PALRTAVLDKAALQRRQMLGIAESLDGGDHATAQLADRDEARARRISVEQNGARAAFALGATLLRADQAEWTTQHVEQTHERRRVDLPSGPVHGERDLHDAFLRACANNRSGVSGSSSIAMPVACSTAAAIAGAPPSIGSSPMPLAP